MKIEIDKKVLAVDIVASLYIGMVSTLSIVNDITRFWIVIPITIIVGVLLYYSFAVQRIGEEIQIKRVYNTRENLMYTSIICGIIVFFGQMFYWSAYFPGGFNLDAYGHWDQVHGYAPLNDWHSVVVTGIYWVLTRINDSIEFCIGVQIIIFSISYAFLIKELGKCGISRKLLYLSAFFVAVVPSVGMNNICIIKDVYFTICLIWIYICLLNLRKVDELKIKDKCIIAVVDFLVILITLIRHNGIFVAIPILLFICMSFRRHMILVIGSLTGFVLSLAIIYGPIFNIANIERHDNIVGEASGILMASMTNAYLNEPDKMPDEVILFLESIADRKDYEEHYILGEWDSCRWDFGGAELLQNENLIKITKYAFMTTMQCPQPVYDSLKENTSIVWQVVGYSDWEPWVYVEKPNQYGISEKPLEVMKSIEVKTNELSHTLLGSIVIWNIGSYILIIAILSVFLAVTKQYKKIFFVLPLLAYAWGTMLLLSGPNQRYFYYFQVMILPILFIILQEERDEKNE